MFITRDNQIAAERGRDCSPRATRRVVARWRGLARSSYGERAIDVLTCIGLSLSPRLNAFFLVVSFGVRRCGARMGAVSPHLYACDSNILRDTFSSSSSLVSNPLSLVEISYVRVKKVYVYFNQSINQNSLAPFISSSKRHPTFRHPPCYYCGYRC